MVDGNGKALGPSLIEVRAVTLDAFAKDHRPPTMVKIDVEGAEAEVWNGAQNLVSQTEPVLLFEVHHQEAATFLESQLRQNTYEIDWLPRHPRFPFPRHLLARPKT